MPYFKAPMRSESVCLVSRHASPAFCPQCTAVGVTMQPMVVTFWLRNKQRNGEQRLAPSDGVGIGMTTADENRLGCCTSKTCATFIRETAITAQHTTCKAN